MTDYFALLNQTRRPWLDADSLKQEFLALSSLTHPDRFHNSTTGEKTFASDQFAALNSAYQCLKEHRDRLRHLVHLELGRNPGDLKHVPEAMADAFMQIAAACRRAAPLVEGKKRMQSPLLQASFFQQVQPELESLEKLQQRVTGMQADALEQMRKLDAAWISSTDREPLVLKLEELAQILGFHSRWLAQLQETHLRLTL